MTRLTVAQALVRFLAAQRVERDGVERPFFAGVFGIFGHGNVAGLGQALQQYPDRLRYYQARNEQAQAAFDNGVESLIDHLLSGGADAVDLDRMQTLINKLAVMGHLYPAVGQRLARADAKALLRRYLNDLAARD